MKNILLLFTLMLSALQAHQCNYKLNFNINTKSNIIDANATISSDYNSLRLLNTKANIQNIQNATLNIKDNGTYLIKKDKNKDIKISFTYKYTPIKNDIIMLDTWYPKVDLLCNYQTTTSNKEFTVITEKNSFPSNNLHLIASKKYKINSMQSNTGIKLSTYFYADDKELSKKYLQKSEKYFKLYKNKFNFLPFNEFSIVETPFPAGYSMPTFTLIGQQIIDKDFVLENSLGHEIAHQWFGNYIYAPYQGNWSEGLTTYYSDYLFAKKNHKEIEYRKNMLIKYNSYVDVNNEISLIEFKSKAKESKNAIGYAKATYFFYMLEQKIGKKAFNNGIKKLLKKYKFKTASYKNLREIFESTSKQKLLDFFKTWVYKKGALEISLSNIDVSYEKDRYILKFNVNNNIGDGFLPITICSNNKCLYTKIDLSKKTPKIELDIEPTKIIIDENYEIFRKLDIKEVPPVISKILQEDVLLVIDKKDEKKFSKMKKIFKKLKYSNEVTYEELKNNNIFILGSKNSLIHQIALSFQMSDDAKIEMFKNPLNEKYVIAVFDMKKLSSKIFYKLQHLGKYSTVTFKDLNVLTKTTKPSSKGIVYELNSASLVIKPQAKEIGTMLDEITKKRVVFIGEQHTQFSSHLNQLKIIKEMYKKNKKLTIAMEMFQKPYQKYLDAFIAGKISEKKMLQKTEYFKRWKYNYELYRPIILFAKKKKIKILAINIDRDITSKVVNKGMDALNKSQKKQIPNSINFSSTNYKDQLRAIYAMHQSKKFKNFEEFYHAQLIGDESMANNMVNYLEKKPNYSMAVVVGNGHVMYGYGIPSRIQRRGITDYTIVLNTTNPAYGIADYILYPSNIKGNKAKKLGVMLEGDKKLKVMGIIKNSPAENATIKKDDILVSFNGVDIKSIAQLKLELAFIKKDAKITLLRDGKKIDLTIVFK